MKPQFKVPTTIYTVEKMKTFKRIIGRIRRAFNEMTSLSERLDEIKINQGIILSMFNQNKGSKKLKDYNFKVFSQWGEDGIIQHLISTIEIKNKTFIEFGVADFFESNCRFLLMKDDWRGFVIDGSTKNIEKLKKSYFYWKHQIDAFDAFITKENINELLAKSGFEEDLGILSIDLDGNDYFILEAINFFTPRILICEYNPVFGSTRKISIPYQPDFFRLNKHYSNLYWGASLSAMTYIADKKGYVLVGTNTAGCNAFYIRKDLINEKLEVLSAEAAYVSSNYRESRDEKGNLSYITADKRTEIIRGLPVLNVQTNSIETI